MIIITIHPDHVSWIVHSFLALPVIITFLICNKRTKFDATHWKEGEPIHE